MKIRHQQKNGKRKMGLHGTGVMVLCCLLWLWAGMALAGVEAEGGEPAKPQRVAVHLIGATEYGAVQVFQHLLEHIISVETVQPVGLHLEPDNPAACRARWQVETDGRPAGVVVEQLLAIIKKLDPAETNQVLYELPFSATAEELALIKQLEPVLIQDDLLYFSIGVPLGLSGLGGGRPYVANGNRWQMLPGAGFD